MYADFQEAFLIFLGEPLRDLASWLVALAVCIALLTPALVVARRMLLRARK